MTEKKKRIRPTLTQVRALEQEKQSLEQCIIDLRKECENATDALQRRSKELAVSLMDNKVLHDCIFEHQEANKKLNMVYLETKEKLQQMEAKLSEVKTLEQSNTLIKQELKRLRSANASLNELNDHYKDQIFELESRGFWARVFNW